MSLGHCLKEGGKEGWNKRERKGVKPGSQYDASSCVSLRPFAFLRGIVNMLRSMQADATQLYARID